MIREDGNCGHSSALKLKDVNRHSEAFSSMESIWLSLAIFGESCKMGNTAPRSEAIKDFEAAR